MERSSQRALGLALVALIALVLGVAVRSWRAADPARPAEPPAADRGDTASIARTATPLSTTPTANADDARSVASAAIESAPESEKTAPARETGGRWIVRVVSDDDARALADVRVTLLPIDASVVMITPVGRARGKVEDEVLTDERGVAEFDVPTETSLQLELSFDGREVALGRELPPLRASEHRSLELRVQSPRLPFVARVVDAIERQPIAGARVRIVRSGAPQSAFGAESRTDADGHAEFELRSLGDQYACVRADGFASAMDLVAAGHADRASALVITVSRGAMLIARVVDRKDAPVADAEVTLSAPDFMKCPAGSSRAVHMCGSVWSATTNAVGLVRIADLDANVPLTVAIESNARAAYREKNALRLLPGEVRNVEWKLEPTLELCGIALDEEGAPVAGVMLWAKRAKPDDASSGPWRNGSRDVEGQTSTDRDGRFCFDPMAGRAWLVGPAPTETALDRESAARAVLPWAELAVAPPDVARHEIELHVRWGLSLRGRVVDAEDRAFAKAAVYLDDPAGEQVSLALSAEDGSFELSPLAPGRYELWAAAPGWIHSDRASVTAGEDGLVITLKRGGALVCRAFDASSGARAPAYFSLTAHVQPTRDDEDMLDWPMTSAPSAEDARFENLRPGKYDLFARAADGSSEIVRDIDVPASLVPIDVTVRTHASGSVRLTYEGSAPHRSVRLVSGRACLDCIDLAPGGAVEKSVPAGSLVVQRALAPSSSDVTVVIVAGQVKDVVLRAE